MLHLCHSVMTAFCKVEKSGYGTVCLLCATGSICGNSLHTAERAAIAPRLPDPLSPLHCSVSAMLQS